MKPWEKRLNFAATLLGWAGAGLIMAGLRAAGYIALGIFCLYVAGWVVYNHWQMRKITTEMVQIMTQIERDEKQGPASE